MFEIEFNYITFRITRAPINARNLKKQIRIALNCFKRSIKIFVSLKFSIRVLNRVIPKISTPI